MKTAKKEDTWVHLKLNTGTTKPTAGPYEYYMVKQQNIGKGCFIAIKDS